MFTLYRLLAAPAMTFAFLLAAPFNKKVRAVLCEKSKKRNPPRFNSPPIWIHAASGEFEYAKPVIREIKQREPNTPVLVTYSSTTFIKAIESFPGVDFSLPLPLDLPGPCAAFLKRYAPKAFLIARTDLWPEILRQTKERKIPIALFSYTQRPPQEMNWLARKTRGWLLKELDWIHCVTEEDAANLRALGIEKSVRVGGDTRYDQVRYRLNHPKVIPPILKPSLPALVAGSTWDEDEAVIFEALTPLLAAREMQLILVPHEPTAEHVEKIEKKLEQLNLMFRKFSEEADWSQSSVLIVDKIGVLAELYRWGNFALVGGSYRSSVHSVMEPLGAGLITIVGPHHTNNREATEFAKIPVGPFTAVQVCSDAQSLRRTAELIVSGNKDERACTILEAFNTRLGKSRELCEVIL